MAKIKVIGSCPKCGGDVVIIEKTDAVDPLRDTTIGWLCQKGHCYGNYVSLPPGCDDDREEAIEYLRKNFRGFLKAYGVNDGKEESV